MQGGGGAQRLGSQQKLVHYSSHYKSMETILGTGQVDSFGGNFPALSTGNFRHREMIQHSSHYFLQSDL